MVAPTLFYNGLGSKLLRPSRSCPGTTHPRARIFGRPACPAGGGFVAGVVVDGRFGDGQLCQSSKPIGGVAPRAMWRWIFRLLLRDALGPAAPALSCHGGCGHGLLQSTRPGERLTVFTLVQALAISPPSRHWIFCVKFARLLGWCALLISGSGLNQRRCWSDL
jgi:hypothetical protein